MTEEEKRDIGSPKVKTGSNKDSKQILEHPLNNDPTKWQTSKTGLPEPGTVGPARGNKKFTLKLGVSPGMAPWLGAANCALAMTTYQAGKIILVGGDGGKPTPKVSERNFGRAMAIAVEEDGFYLSTGFTIWRFANSLRSGETHKGWDKFYLPRSCHVTGAVDVHDLKIASDKRQYIVVTRYNSIAEVTDEGSFSPLWRPKWIDKLVGEDRCHLNGFVLVGDRPRFATITAQTNKLGAWREHRHDGGMIMDITTNEPILEGLAMPHSPHIKDGYLWFLESGRGYLKRLDLNTGQVDDVAWVPGFARGLKIYQGKALIGLSKPRYQVFAGLPLDEELQKRGKQPLCGVVVVDLQSGEIENHILLGGALTEIYDVAILPGVKAPFLVGLQGPEVQTYVTLPKKHPIKHSMEQLTPEKGDPLASYHPDVLGHDEPTMPG